MPLLEYSNSINVNAWNKISEMELSFPPVDGTKRQQLYLKILG